MKTVLVSRFNWPHPKWNNDYGPEYQSWIDNRLELFENFTVKSVRNCYEKPDLWLILIADFAKNLKPRLDAMLKGLNYKLVIYKGKPVVESVRDALADLSYPEEIRMSRLDTDDLIASDFFAQIRALPIEENLAEDGVAVSFPGGANYTIDTDTFYMSSYPANPFLTYVQKVSSSGELDTVFHDMHINLPNKSKHQRMIRSFHPMWATIIHSSNLANDSLNDTNKVELGSKDYIKQKFGMPQGSTK